MPNLEYLEKVKKFDEANDTYHKLGTEEFITYRKIKALEIIAEQIINLDNTLACINTTLENIENIINQRLKY